ncbi:MAG: hypothetical protein ACJ79V_04615 [Myxococcales bacterium]
MAPGKIRLSYVGIYGAFAALGAALLSRPALEWVRGLGLFAPALPLQEPLGWASAVLLLLLVAGTIGMAMSVALGLKPGIAGHAVLLGLVACALALRAGSEPATRPDPDPALRDALGAAASVLDASYALERRYDPDVRKLQGALDALPRSPFRFRAQAIRYTVRLLRGAIGPQREPLPGDGPATVYVAISHVAQRGWVTVTTLRDGKVSVLPTTLEARFGAHAEEGRDVLVPPYPGMVTAPR